jgi:hypothetical protein
VLHPPICKFAPCNHGQDVKKKVKMEEEEKIKEEIETS